MATPGLLVVTHGRLAEDLADAIRTIVGNLDSLQAVSIDWDDDVNESRARIESALRDLDRGAGVLILTDMFGGTPTNLALSFLEPGKVEVVTGVNLPMLVKYTNLREEADFQGIARKIAEQGRKAIQVASDVLAGPEGGGAGERP